MCCAKDISDVVVSLANIVWQPYYVLNVMHEDKPLKTGDYSDKYEQCCSYTLTANQCQCNRNVAFTATAKEGV